MVELNLIPNLQGLFVWAFYLCTSRKPLIFNFGVYSLRLLLIEKFQIIKGKTGYA